MSNASSRVSCLGANDGFSGWGFPKQPFLWEKKAALLLPPSAFADTFSAAAAGQTEPGKTFPPDPGFGNHPPYSVIKEFGKAHSLPGNGKRKNKKSSSDPGFRNRPPYSVIKEFGKAHSLPGNGKRKNKKSSSNPGFGNRPPYPIIKQFGKAKGHPGNRKRKNKKSSPKPRFRKREKKSFSPQTPGLFPNPGFENSLPYPVYKKTNKASQSH